MVPTGTVGKAGTPLVEPLRAVVDERRQALARQMSIGLLISGAMPQVSLAGLPAAQAFILGVCTVTGFLVASPARLLHGHPSVARFYALNRTVPRILG